MKKAIGDFYDGKLEKCAKMIVKYQKFRSKKIVEVISSLGYPNNSTLLNYVNYGISYILYGKKSKIVPKKLYQYIDSYIAHHLQPLTPSATDARRQLARKYQEKNTILPVQKIPEVKQELTKIFEYGVRIENRIILFDNEHSMATFIKNAKFVNPDIELQPVTVECENYERK